MTDLKARFAALAKRLSSIVDSEPERALQEARILRSRRNAPTEEALLKASILVDAGRLVRDVNAIRESIMILRRLQTQLPNRLDIAYNLGNSLTAAVDLNDTPRPNWFVETFTQRREARCLFHDVGRNDKSGALQSQALVNLGNQLHIGHRWVEAYDSWIEAIRTDRTNGVAALNLATMLLRRIATTPRDYSLQRIAGFYARTAKRGGAHLEQIAGRRATELAVSLPTFKSRWRPTKPHALRDPLKRFIAQHRLALLGAIEGADYRKSRIDSAYIHGFAEATDAGHEVPPLFAMLNQLKADYCAARWVAFNALHSSPTDSSLYMDTLDYALYGSKPSLLILAQRSAIDVLDRIAVCANEYFGCGETPANIFFRTFWREGNGTGAWRAIHATSLSEHNPGVVAMSELASDLSEGGALAIHQELRNTGTHRFAVVHDEGNTGSRPSPAIVHHNLFVFRAQTIRTLQIARAAILYLFDAIDWHENQGPRHGALGTMHLMPHHYIRGK